MLFHPCFWTPQAQSQVSILSGLWVIAMWVFCPIHFSLLRHETQEPPGLREGPVTGLVCGDTPDSFLMADRPGGDTLPCSSAPEPGVCLHSFGPWPGARDPAGSQGGAASCGHCRDATARECWQPPCLACEVVFSHRSQLPLSHLFEVAESKA